MKDQEKKKKVKIPKIIRVKRPGAKFSIVVSEEMQKDFEELYKKDLEERGIEYE